MAMVVFAPWAFGVTQVWSIWTMNAGGYILGALLVLKWVVRRIGGFQPARWSLGGGRRWPLVVLAVLTVVILAYVLASGLNPRAVMDYTFTPGVTAASGVEPEYFEPVSWLPSSYDGPRTLRAFWKYLAMAASFWAARDWLLGLSRRERRAAEPGSQLFPPARVATLLWTLTISTALLSVVGVLQRLDGTRKLLFFYDGPNWGNMNFGPFAYRGHAAEYLNLVWPVALGFWWVMRYKFVRTMGGAARAGGGPHILLLPLAAIIAIGPFLATSRGGLLIETGLLPACILVLFFAQGTGALVRSVLVAAAVLLVGIGWMLGGEALMERFGSAGSDRLGGREEIYEVAGKMEKDFVAWGSGAETFPRLYYLYRASPEQKWHAYAHDDYLETRITFGLGGFALVLAALLMVPLSSLVCGGIAGPREFLLLLTIGMGGMLLHARFDFPFQSYCLHFEFLMLCALLSCLAGLRRT